MAEEVRKAAASGYLDRAAKTRDIAECQEALAGAREAGLEQVDFHSAETVLAEEERKVAARVGLKHAQETRDIADLQPAIQEGERAGLESDELEVARNALAEMAQAKVASLTLLFEDAVACHCSNPTQESQSKLDTAADLLVEAESFLQSAVGHSILPEAGPDSST